MTTNRILIVGASGFIGNSLYKELLSYFDVYGTYCEQHGIYGENQVFIHFDAEKDSLQPILEKLEPRFIISCFSASFKSQLKTHNEIIEYCSTRALSQALYISSSEVFDGQKEFPSYENDPPDTDSIDGLRRLANERLFLQDLPFQSTILRLPMVLGVNSPLLLKLRNAIKHQTAFEVFPNHILSVTTSDKVAQQIHFIINKELTGIFHLSSSDMIHHDDLFQEIATKISDRLPAFKQVYHSNEDDYLAILPKETLLPEEYRITVNDVIDTCTLSEEITIFKRQL